MNAANGDTVVVDVLGVFLEPSTGASIVLLRESPDAGRVLPIFVGPAEAQAIVIALQGIELPRPATHDLMVDVLESTDVRMVAVVVTGLEAGTFMADLVVEFDGDIRAISARPSDGIALALRTGADIAVARFVLDEAAVEIEHGSEQTFDDEQIESIVSSFRDFLATADASDFAIGDDDGEEGGISGEDPESPSS